MSWAKSVKRCGLVRPTLAAAIVVVVLGGTTSSTLGQERLNIEGLRAPVAVARDADGIVHIFAKNEHDLSLAQGWAHARDRLFQMDISRRQASGTLAELLGQAVLPGDVELRAIGLRRAAACSLRLANEGCPFIPTRGLSQATVDALEG
jgi:acyl-homoserine lactone acylase PvdQ